MMPHGLSQHAVIYFRIPCIEQLQVLFPWVLGHGVLLLCDWGSWFRLAYRTEIAQVIILVFVHILVSYNYTHAHAPHAFGNN